MSKKKIGLLSIVLVLVMALASACGSKEKEASPSPSPSPVSEGANEGSNEGAKEGADSESPSEENKDNNDSDSKSNGSKKDVDLGSVVDGVYKNDYFGVTVDLPKDWEVQDGEVMKELMEIGKDVIAGDDESKKKQLEIAELKVLNLLMVSQYPLGEVEPNPSVIVLAEKVSKLQGISSGEDYLLANKKVLESTGIPYEFNEITTTNIGGKEFHVMVLTVEIDTDFIMTQKYYSTVFNGYAFNFITTAEDDETIAATDQVVQSAKFE